MPKSTRCGTCGKPIKGHTRRAAMPGGKGGGRSLRMTAIIRDRGSKRPDTRQDAKACCDNERRTFSGGCLNCDDPSF